MIRLPEVPDIAEGDFIVLPCDLIWEIRGEALIKRQMTKKAVQGEAIKGG